MPAKTKPTFELRPVRLSFPHLVTPHAAPPTKDQPNPKAQYQTACVIDERTLADQIGVKQLQTLIAAVRAAAIDKFKDAAANFMMKVLYGKQNSKGEIGDKGIRSPFVDGEEKDFGPKTLVFNLKSDYPLGLVDRAGQRVTDPAAIRDMFYPGCYARVFVTLRAYNVNGGTGVALDPAAVQFWGDGERLDNRIDPTELCGALDTPEPGSLESLIGQAA